MQLTIGGGVFCAFNVLSKLSERRLNTFFVIIINEICILEVSINVEADYLRKVILKSLQVFAF